MNRVHGRVEHRQRTGHGWEAGDEKVWEQRWGWHREWMVPSALRGGSLISNYWVSPAFLTIPCKPVLKREQISTRFPSSQDTGKLNWGTKDMRKKVFNCLYTSAPYLLINLSVLLSLDAAHRTHMPGMQKPVNITYLGRVKRGREMANHKKWAVISFWVTGHPLPFPLFLSYSTLLLFVLWFQGTWEVVKG